MTFFQDEIVNKSLRHLFIRLLFPLRVSEKPFVLVMKVPAIFSLVYLLLPSFFHYKKTHEFGFFKVKNDFLAMIY